MLFKIIFRDVMEVDFEEYKSLDDAKEKAGDIAEREFPECDITIIKMENGIETLETYSRWFAYPPDEEDYVWFELFGGFYEMWQDEIYEAWEERFIM